LAAQQQCKNNNDNIAEQQMTDSKDAAAAMSK